jgi:hypothetical protein
MHDQGGADAKGGHDPGQTAAGEAVAQTMKKSGPGATATATPTAKTCKKPLSTPISAVSIFTGDTLRPPFPKKGRHGGLPLRVPGGHGPTGADIAPRPPTRGRLPAIATRRAGLGREAGRLSD